MRNVTCILCLAAAGGLYAQNGDNAPHATSAILGFDYDEAQSAIRLIRGIPGAALLDGAVPLDLKLTRAHIAPSHAFALATAEDDGALRVVLLAEGGTDSRPIDAAVAADRVVFSPSGSSALLFESSSGRLQVVSGLPDAPRVRDLEPLVNPGAMAVDDRGETALIAVDGELLEVSGVGLRRFPIAAAALAFRAKSPDAVAVTGSGTILARAGLGDWRTVAGDDDRAANSAGVQLSSDGGYALMASRSGMLSTIELASGARAWVDCGCAPSALEPLQAGSFYRVTSISAPPLWLLDVSRPSAPAAWFVPARSGQ